MLDIFTYTETDYSMTEAEEVAAIEAAQAGDEAAKMDLLRAYGPALRSALSTFTNGVKRNRDGDAGLGSGSSAFEVGDAQNAAVVAVLELIESHDPEQSPRLAGRVRQVLAEALAALYSDVMPWRIPSRTLKRFYGILKAADGDPVAALALASEYGMGLDTFRDVLAAVRSTDSLEGLGGPDEGEGGHAGSLDARPIYATTPVADVEDRILVEMAFGAVTDEEARIVELAYGFTEYEPLADGEIAERLNLYRSTVQRKRASALDGMRKAIGVTHA